MTSETFGACGCPVTSAGVMHNYGCVYGGMRARAYTRASANEVTARVAVNPFGLSRREVEVAKRMIQGQANKEIALALVISVSTVKAHMGEVMRKTSTTNRTAAAYRLGSGLGT